VLLLDGVPPRSGPRPASTRRAPTVGGGTRSIATARLNPSVAAEAAVPGTQTDAVVHALAALIRVVPQIRGTAALSHVELQIRGTAVLSRVVLQIHGTAAPSRVAASSHHVDSIRSPNARMRLRAHRAGLQPHRVDAGRRFVDPHGHCAGFQHRCVGPGRYRGSFRRRRVGLRCHRVGSCRSLVRSERLARQTSPRIHRSPRRRPSSRPRDFRLRRGHHRRVDRAGVHDGCGVHRCVPNAHRPGHCRCLRPLRCDCRCHPVANHPQAGPGRLDRSCQLPAGLHPRAVRHD
jgi:hypothetical protein